VKTKNLRSNDTRGEARNAFPGAIVSDSELIVRQYGLIIGKSGVDFFEFFSWGREPGKKELEGRKTGGPMVGFVLSHPSSEKLLDGWGTLVHSPGRLKEEYGRWRDPMADGWLCAFPPIEREAAR
jgi:hypothetical protein